MLSIDGGGTRGALPALVLAEIERRAGKPTSELFDLVAGTSIGGILALEMATPGKDGSPKFNPAEAIEWYWDHGGEIFHTTEMHRIHAVGGLLEPKYETSSFAEAMAGIFGELRLSDALTDVFIPSYELEGRNPFFFRSRIARDDPYEDFRMRDVAIATASAPTYFEPARLTRTDGTKESFVDGGVCLNNPAVAAYADTVDQLGHDPDLILVSLGTGSLDRPLVYDEVRHWGLANWARPILELAIDGVNHAVDWQMERLLSPHHYFRLQPHLRESRHIDDASRRNLEQLREIAAELIVERSEEIDRVCEILLAPGEHPREAI